MERICLIDGENVESLHFPLYRATGDIVKVSIQTMCPMLASATCVFHCLLCVVQSYRCCFFPLTFEFHVEFMSVIFQNLSPLYM